MYRCALCQAVVPPRTPAIRVVLRTRPRTYPYRADAHSYLDKKSGKRKIKDDPGGHGYEFVEEALVCHDCAAAYPRHDAHASPPVGRGSPALRQASG
jgi:hypothetical protein